MPQVIIVINAGSTSLKFSAYGMDAAGSLPLLCHGEIGGMEDDPRFVAKNPEGKPLATHDWGAGQTIDHKAALHFVITWLEANIADLRVVAAGHRIVLGGPRFETPVRIEGDVLDYLDSLSAMEPSHQPYNVLGIRALAEAFPHVPQVACFDNSFHKTMPEVAQIYALPKDVRDAGVRHWGYHGISYDYISRQISKFAPKARRVIAAHLGGGASLCAMLDGQSVETTMGFAGLSGLPMETRSGDVPPEVLTALVLCVQKLARAVRTAMGAEGVTVHQFNEPAGGQSVYHIHFHVMPRWEGVALRPHGGKMADPAVLKGHADKIRAALAAES